MSETTTHTLEGSCCQHCAEWIDSLCLCCGERLTERNSGIRTWDAFPSQDFCFPCRVQSDEVAS